MTTVRCETITPKKAKKDLENANKTGSNTRRLIWTAVERLARAMTTGQWEMNGCSIVYDDKGLVVDGQHRLAACVKADTPFETIVVKGVVSTLHVDTGSRRQAGQILTHRLGIKNGPLVAALARMLLTEMETGSVVRGGGGNYQPNNEDILIFVTKNTKMRASADLGAKCAPFVRPTVAAYVHYGACTITHEEDFADEFFTAMIEGSAKPGSAAYQVHRRLIHAKLRKETLARFDEMALLIKAWNAHITDNEQAKIVLGRRGPWRPETFPSVISASELL